MAKTRNLFTLLTDAVRFHVFFLNTYSLKNKHSQIMKNIRINSEKIKKTYTASENIIVKSPKSTFFNKVIIWC